MVQDGGDQPKAREPITQGLGLVCKGPPSRTCLFNPDYIQKCAGFLDLEAEFGAQNPCSAARDPWPLREFLNESPIDPDTQADPWTLRSLPLSSMSPETAHLVGNLGGHIKDRSQGELLRTPVAGGSLETEQRGTASATTQSRFSELLDTGIDFWLRNNGEGEIDAAWAAFISSDLPAQGVENWKESKPGVIKQLRSFCQWVAGCILRWLKTMFN
ncbi:hypothetical protein NM208_g8190 [Fusarium decemcellulare]|uniref:Uncharacterized protein n=1 Tax=Fusarium decemcellulare TaxID=57161 RepID=A0ACC1S6F7_9HYPO|nr:hypothetical protein NM208_g8190 [Fusarium decemcellulare]